MNAGENMGKVKPSFTIGGNESFSTEIIMQNSQKLKINLPHDPAILVFGIRPKTHYPTIQILAQPCPLLFSLQ